MSKNHKILRTNPFMIKSNKTLHYLINKLLINKIINKFMNKSKVAL